MYRRGMVVQGAQALGQNPAYRPSAHFTDKTPLVAATGRSLRCILYGERQKEEQDGEFQGQAVGILLTWRLGRVQATLV
jgi:hypothetical protein